MPQGTSFTCTDCGERIEDSPSPLIAYLVVGLAPLHPITKAGEYTPEEVAAFPMPAIMRDAFNDQTQRLDFCTGCLAKALNLPMTDKDGNEIVSAQDAESYMDRWTPPESGKARVGRILAAAQAEAAKDAPVSVAVPG